MGCCSSREWGAGGKYKGWRWFEGMEPVDEITVGVDVTGGARMLPVVQVSLLVRERV